MKDKRARWVDAGSVGGPVEGSAIGRARNRIFRGRSTHVEFPPGSSIPTTRPNNVRRLPREVAFRVHKGRLKLRVPKHGDKTIENFGPGISFIPGDDGSQNDVLQAYNRIRNGALNGR